MPHLSETLKLHLEETFLFRFEARVLSVGCEGEGLVRVACDRTAFYVESGGQPSDGGFLAGREVVGLRFEEGVVWHILRGEAPPRPGNARDDSQGPPARAETPLEPGATVAGEVDAARRLDHMQQHTGQHILSQAFMRAGPRPTHSFHLGREECTIDLSGPPPDPALLDAAFDLANACVLDDRPVRVHQVSRDDLARYPVRREPGGQRDVLRLIEIEDFDWSACGGTHAARTGQVGPIHILGAEKAKALWRIRFVAGRRALRYLAEAHRVLQEVARDHSIHWKGLPEAARLWQAETQTALKEVRRLRQELEEKEGEKLYHSTPADVEGVRRLFLWLGDLSAEALRRRAARFAALGPALVLVGSGQEDRAHWISARSAELPDGLASWSALEQLRVWVDRLGGRGGGTPLLAQGSSRRPDPREIEELEARGA